MENPFPPSTLLLPRFLLTIKLTQDGSLIEYIVISFLCYIFVELLIDVLTIMGGYHGQ